MEYLIITILHIMGVAIGVGGATATDPLFLSSIRNRKITSDQLVLLHNVSRVVIGGLALVILSGIAHVLLQPEIVVDPTFLAKMFIVLVIALNGFVFHGWVLPRLEGCVDRRMGKEFLSQGLPLMAGAGAVSGVSWYSALILGVLLHFPVPFWLIITGYLMLATGAVIAAYLVMSHIIFSPQPEPQEVLEKERFPQAMRWTPVLLATAVVVIIFISLFQL